MAIDLTTRSDVVKYHFLSITRPSSAFLTRIAAIVLSGWLCIVSGQKPAIGDEGMWLFSNLPIELLKQRHSFEPTAEWTDQLMRSSVRFNSGGSGSFVSSNGLVLTNQHVGSDTLQKLSTAENDLVTRGYVAMTLEEELPAPDLELNQLISITCMTERVNNAIKMGMTAADAAAARRAVIADIETEFNQQTGNRCNVITMYGGGQYHLYEYKVFTDVRLVWAPEHAVAQFGGDADNFEYPRYCLDACLFRVYEGDKPAVIGNFLKWSVNGPAETELVFVSGNPGNTSRIFTSAAIRYERDFRIPDVLNFVRRREILLQQYSLNGPEQKRQASDELVGFQNARKAYSGMLAGLQNPEYLAELEKREQEMREQLAADPALAELSVAWDEIESVQHRRAELGKRSFTLNTRLYWFAQTLTRMAEEDRKPNNERLPEFRDSNRESLLQRLLSTAAVYHDLERVKLADMIGRTLEIRGGDDALCQQMLDGKIPSYRADTLVCQTRLMDRDFRKQLVDGGSNSIDASDDPLLVFARVLNGEQRLLRLADEELDEREIQAYSKISRALFALRGTSIYPDATFTLRLAFGVVSGYEEGGLAIPAWTTMDGAFEHEAKHNGNEPWQLPESWHESGQKIPGNTPLNFICTADIIGGNSGSPVVNKNLELVGIIFDGNLQSLTGDFYYSEHQARAIGVHSEAIRQALSTIYAAPSLADQLGK